jgi:hypothetical protein
VLCRVVLCRVVLCCVVSCHVVSCRVVLCRVVSCCVVSCRVVSCRVVLCCIISSYTCLASCTNCFPSLSYHISFGHYLQLGYFTLLHFRYFEPECRLQTFDRPVFLNTLVKINITQVKYSLFQRNGRELGTGRCSCLERGSVYLSILKHK